MRRIALTLMILSLGVTASHCQDRTNDPLDKDNARVEKVIRLHESRLTESSGLAFSNHTEGLFWTHNDSGGEARLFAFDQSGASTGVCELDDVNAKDWEDVAAFQFGGEDYLIAADFGDNLSQRKDVELYLFKEPNPRKKKEIKNYLTFKLKYVDGAHNCEAIAVDPDQRKVFLVTKKKLPVAGVYEFELPETLDLKSRSVVKKVANRIGTVNVPMISAMDFDPASGDAWVINYFHAFRFPATASRVEQFKQTPTVFELPHWKQIEAVAVDSKQKVWVTTEGKSTPMGRLSLSTEIPLKSD